MIPHPSATFLRPSGGAWIEVSERPSVELVDYDDRFLNGSPRSPIVHVGRDALWVWRERFIPEGGKVVTWAQYAKDVFIANGLASDVD